MMAVATMTVATWSLRIDRDPMCCAAQVTGRMGAVTYFYTVTLNMYARHSHTSSQRHFAASVTLCDDAIAKAALQIVVADAPERFHQRERHADDAGHVERETVSVVRRQRLLARGARERRERYR